MLYARLKRGLVRPRPRRPGGAPVIRSPDGLPLRVLAVEFGPDGRALWRVEIDGETVWLDAADAEIFDDLKG